MTAVTMDKICLFMLRFIKEEISGREHDDKKPDIAEKSLYSAARISIKGFSTGLPRF